MESSTLIVVCVNKCTNNDFIKEFNLETKFPEFIPGRKYKYHNCPKKRYNYIYDIMTDVYHGCITKEFLNKNFTTNTNFNELDSLFDKFYEG